MPLSTPIDLSTKLDSAAASSLIAGNATVAAAVAASVQRDPLTSLSGVGSPTGNVLEIVDAADNLLARIGPSGVLELHGLSSAGSVTLPATVGTVVPTLVPLQTISGVGDMIVAFTDASDSVYGGYLVDGTPVGVVNGALQALSGAQTAVSYSFDATTGATFDTNTNLLRMFIVWGQSLAAGGNANASDAVVTTAAPHAGYALMFNPGPWPDGRAITSFADLVESRYSSTAETICSQFAKGVIDRCNSALGFKPKILMTVAASGGQPYTNIKRGTAVYTELLRLVTTAKTLAVAQGLTLEVAGILMMHGEQDFGDGTERDRYRRMITQGRTMIEEDVRRITGQGRAVRLITYQTNRGSSGAGLPTKPALAQLDAMNVDSLVTCAGPIYHVPLAATDTAHPSAIGYAQIGAQFADVALSELFGATFQPTHIVEAWWQTASTIRVRYGRAITLDTSNAVVDGTALGAGLGFDATDTTGTLTISGVAAVSGTTDTLEITLSATPTGKRPRLFYAQRVTGAGGMGNQTGARGCVRASASYATSVTGPALYHWATVQVFDL
jgi:hypothetical protein